MVGSFWNASICLGLGLDLFAELLQVSLPCVPIRLRFSSHFSTTD